MVHQDPAPCVAPDLIRECDRLDGAGTGTGTGTEPEPQPEPEPSRSRNRSQNPSQSCSACELPKSAAQRLIGAVLGLARLFYQVLISSRHATILAGPGSVRDLDGFGPQASDLVEPDPRPEAQGPRSRGTRYRQIRHKHFSGLGARRSLVAARAALSSRPAARQCLPRKVSLIAGPTEAL